MNENNTPRPAPREPQELVKYAEGWLVSQARIKELQAALQQAEATIQRLTQERDNVRACLDSLVADVKAAFGERFRRIVDDASGDISINTAFKVALAEEREAAQASIPHLQALVEQMRRYEATGVSRRLIKEWADRLAALVSGSATQEKP